MIAHDPPLPTMTLPPIRSEASPQSTPRATAHGPAGPPARAQGWLSRLILVLALAVLVLAMPSMALAQNVPHLTGPVTDQTGQLASRTSDIESEIARVRDTDGVEVWVLFVRTTGGVNAEDYAREVFQSNSLGSNDALYVVALDDRTDEIQVSTSLGITNAQITGDIIPNVSEPRLRNGDYAGAVIAVVDALGQANRGQAAATQAPGGAGGLTVTPVATTGSAGSPGQPTPDLTPLLAIVAIVIGVAIVVAWARARLVERRRAEERDRHLDKLAHDANALLIDTDDAVRGAQQEVGFVEAQFGASDAATFRDGLTKATAELKAAFAVRQQLDDDVPEDPPTKEAMLNDVVARAQRAAARLDEQRKRIASLREFEAHAPELLASLPATIDALAAQLPTTQAAFQRLRAYAPETWAAVSGNGTEAEKRIAAARDAVATGRAALGIGAAASPTGTAAHGAGTAASPGTTTGVGMGGAAPVAADSHAAAQAARVAQAAVTEAGTLLDAIEKLAASLDETRQRLAAEIVAAAPDVERARKAVDTGKGDTDAGQHVADAERLLADARREAASERPNVLTGYQAAQQANHLADSVLDEVREEEERAARAAAALAAGLHSAAVSVDRATDYINSRRHGVGREARTRLAEAERHLALANQLQAGDAAKALAEAQVAQRYADEAYELARNDFDDFDIGGGQRRGGNDMGALIGGIVLGSILGGMGGGRRGGWGGTPWGGGGFGGFGGGGGSLGGGGSFGGGGSQGGGGHW